MQLLDDHSAEMIQGGHHKNDRDKSKPLRQLFALGIQQLNLAINIIIGSGNISSIQSNLTSIGNRL